MGRKNLLEHLIAPSGTPPNAAPAIRKPMPRGVGLVGAMSESVETMAADLRDAKEKLEAGDVIVEINTDLIDPSFITDRIGEDDQMDAFVATIRDQGQRTPILLRPHPESPGRYQIAFGHRRYRALKRLGRPVRAMVKQLTDEELVVAQGQENQDRLDLSYVERALFAARLEARSFQRDVICLALSVDKTEVSRMVSIATALPGELVEAIGPAQKTGRRKWMDLAKTFEQISWSTEKERLLEVCTAGGAADSDQRFDLVLKALSRGQPPAEAGHHGEPRPSFTVDKKPGVIRIRFDETSLPKDVVEDLMSQVRTVCTSFGVKS
jgi:ParB family transcriptional regulator, chromosome partitioning protein